MNDAMKMWVIDNSKKGAKPVDAAKETDTEKELEEVLVSNPEMLMPGLTLARLPQLNPDFDEFWR